MNNNYNNNNNNNNSNNNNNNNNNINPNLEYIVKIGKKGVKIYLGVLVILSIIALVLTAIVELIIYGQL